MPFHTSAPTLNRRAAVRLGSSGIAAGFTLRGIRSTAAQEATALESNKALVRRVFKEVINGGNAAVVAELHDPEYVNRGALARQMPGPAGMPLPIDEFHAVFPDVYVTIEDVVAEGDLVAIRATWHGAHPPAGTHVVGRTMHLFRIADGRIIEQWSTGWEWLAQSGDRPRPRPTIPFAAGG